MPPVTEKYSITDFSSGMATNLNSNLAPGSLMKLIVNGDCDEEIGSIVSRLGTGIIGAQLVDNKSILGLHQHVDHSNSANNKLFAVVNDAGNANADIWDVTGAAIVGADDTASLKARFLTYLGQTLRVNGTDVPRVYNGRAFVSTATFTADAGTDVITSTAHNLSDGDTIWVSNSGGALPGNLAASTTYYVRDRTTDTFKLAATSGGAAIDISGAGTGTHTWSFQGVFDRVNMPTGHKYVAEFLDRVYLAGNTTLPDRIIYSSIPDATTGQVSWTTGNGYLDIEPEDGGGPITGFGKVPGYLLIFKERALKRWNFNSTFPESLVSIGTPSQESVVSGGGLCAFFSNSNSDARGFYITNGGRPIPISHDTTRPIKKWIDAIPTANDANIAGWGTDRGFAWSVGDLTVDGVSYTNVVLRYNRILDQWSVRTYPTEFKVFAPYIASGVTSVIAGDDDGQVIQVDKAGTYTDYPSTTPIQWAVETHGLTFGTNKLKRITDRLIVRGDNIQGAAGSIIVDGEQKRNPTGRAKKLLSLFGLDDSLEGTEVALRVDGATTGARAYLRELELSAILVTDNYL